MEVRYDEGVAIHIGPEPCVAAREGGDEASVGERIGQPLSLEKIIPGADVVAKTEGDMDGRVSASARTARRGRRPWMSGSSLCGNREIARLTSLE